MSDQINSAVVRTAQNFLNTEMLAANWFLMQGGASVPGLARVNFDAAAMIMNMGEMYWTIVYRILISKIRTCSADQPYRGPPADYQGTRREYFAELSDYILRLEDFIYSMEEDLAWFESTRGGHLWNSNMDDSVPYMPIL